MREWENITVNTDAVRTQDAHGPEAGSEKRASEKVSEGHKGADW